MAQTLRGKKEKPEPRGGETKNNLIRRFWVAATGVM